MAFWTTLVDHDNEFQPKLADRFVVIMGGSGETFSQKIIFTVKSVTKPSIDIETKDFKLMNHKFKYPGIVTWQPIKITFVDMAGSINEKKPKTPTFENFIDSNTFLNKDSKKAFKNDNFQNTAAVLAFILYGSGYDTPGMTGGGNTGTGKEKVNNILDSLRIQQLDVTPTADGKMRVVEEWQLFNPIIKSISWGDLAYGEDSLVEYSIDIDYDFAEFSTGGNIGEQASRGSGTPLTSTETATDSDDDGDDTEDVDITAAP